MAIYLETHASCGKLETVHSLFCLPYIFANSNDLGKIVSDKQYYVNF